MSDVVAIDSLQLPEALEGASEACRKAYPELRARYGEDLEYIQVSGYDFVYTVPPEKDWERFMDTPKEQRAHGMKLLVLASVKYPALDDLRAAIARRPAAVQTLSNVIGKLAGIDQEAVAKKL